jgi:hypothetical protein
MLMGVSPELKTEGSEIFSETLKAEQFRYTGIWFVVAE